MFTAKNSSATGSMVSDVILHLVSRRTHLLPVHTWLTMFAPLPSSPFFAVTTNNNKALLLSLAISPWFDL